jgi:hypothetical protein
MRAGHRRPSLRRRITSRSKDHTGLRNRTRERSQTLHVMAVPGLDPGISPGHLDRLERSAFHGWHEAGDDGERSAR